MNSKHTFIAIPVKINLQRKAVEWQSSLRLANYFKKMVNMYDFHVTLLFLGGWGIDKRVMLWKRLEEKLSDTADFTLNFSTIDLFGEPKRPRVIYMAPAHSNRLMNLQSFIHEEAVKLGFSREKRNYRPHITLAKKWHDSTHTFPYEEKFPKSIEMETLLVDKICMYEVCPFEEPKYKVIASIPLGKEEN